MSVIKTPIIRVIKKLFGENSVSDNIDIERVKEYFTDDLELGEIIEHFRLKPSQSHQITASKYGVILQDLNDLFNELKIPYNCVGVYFKGDYLNVLIKG